MGDETVERTNLFILLVFLPLVGAVFVGVYRRKMRWWHVAGLAVVAVVFLMGPFKARTFASASVFYYHTDHLNTPVKMTDQGGAVVWDVEQKHPFGDFDVKGATVALTATDGSTVNYTVENPLRFPGQYNDYPYRALITDNGKGPYYNWNRWYSPQQGRYYEVDPLSNETQYIPTAISSCGRQINSEMLLNGQPLYPYQYSDDNPVLYIDSSGLWWQNLCKPDITCPKGYELVSDEGYYLKCVTVDYVNKILTIGAGAGILSRIKNVVLRRAGGAAIGIGILENIIKCGCDQQAWRCECE
jgi:RHS repeat-associated protein